MSLHIRVHKHSLSHTLNQGKHQQKLYDVQFRSVVYCLFKHTHTLIQIATGDNLDLGPKETPKDPSPSPVVENTQRSTCSRSNSTIAKSLALRTLGCKESSWKPLSCRWSNSFFASSSLKPYSVPYKMRICFPGSSYLVQYWSLADSGVPPGPSPPSAMGERSYSSQRYTLRHMTLSCCLYRNTFEYLHVQTVEIVCFYLLCSTFAIPYTTSERSARGWLVTHAAHLRVR